MGEGMIWPDYSLTHIAILYYLKVVIAQAATISACVAAAIFENGVPNRKGRGLPYRASHRVLYRRVQRACQA